jgi:hypothetical protein
MNTTNPWSQQSTAQPDSIGRRRFIGNLTAATIGVSIAPSHVFGTADVPAPSERINVACIGMGTQGLRQLGDLLKIPEVQVVAVCDPQLKSAGYRDWSPTGLRDGIRKLIGNDTWTPSSGGTIPGGREDAKAIVDAFYAATRPGQTLGGCRTYTDFRELFAKEHGLDAVQVITPDHLHGLIAVAAMKRGIAISMHKPVANRLREGWKAIDLARRSDVVTHLIPWDANGSMDQVMAWIDGGAIGELREVHNWSFRPVWPQYSTIPTSSPPLPDGLDWDLWLGPEAERPYHPNYANMVFRGWYDFGGGSMADMGHYSLWSVFEALKLEKPTIIEPRLSHVCGLKDDGSAFMIRNDYSFPDACSVRFKYPRAQNRAAVDLVWHDGGMQPTVPQEFYDQGKEFPSEGMMFKGDKGTIMAGFWVDSPYVLSGEGAVPIPAPVPRVSIGARGIKRFIEGVRKKEQIAGNFRQAWPITEAVNLYAAALRANKTLHYDANQMRVTNDATAGRYLDRSYRTGWELESI